MAVGGIVGCGSQCDVTGGTGAERGLKGKWQHSIWTSPPSCILVVRILLSQYGRPKRPPVGTGSSNLRYSSSLDEKLEGSQSVWTVLTR
ncbi:hypothetical protein EYF80_029014 [Liparis tanakae]|uniref:Uncharacterized protein n=1 Tax=Liparis tanakae TaxID=230148 RepID=A0A4Z2H5J9_9TELE|nr:hypothetical protein EYF80_029014 [Liparis tanakae]